MRHDQIRRLDDVIAIEDQIQIKGTWCTWVGALAAKSFLDIEEQREQLSRGERRLPRRDRIQEDRLFADADGRRVVKARRSKRLDVGAQRLDCGAQSGVTISEIAAERDRDPGNGSYSCQRAGRTAPTRVDPAVRRPMTSSRPAPACSNRR
jgi:hypothetical protein